MRTYSLTHTQHAHTLACSLARSLSLSPPSLSLAGDNIGRHASLGSRTKLITVTKLNR